MINIRIDEVNSNVSNSADGSPHKSQLPNAAHSGIRKAFEHDGLLNVDDKSIDQESNQLQVNSDTYRKPSYNIRSSIANEVIEEQEIESSPDKRVKEHAMLRQPNMLSKDSLLKTSELQLSDVRSPKDKKEVPVFLNNSAVRDRQYKIDEDGRR